MSENNIASSPIILTEQAEKQILKIIANEPSGTILRISVEGGGCSGFSYQYNLVQETPTDEDLTLGASAPIVLIDSLSQEFMAGSKIDFVDELAGQSFQISNPNAVASCGCGSSFAV